ncbi:MAG: nucleotidyltransferase family protein [Opitutae bacterium]|nr:nucleotidyltransferase family protein [Opitutae bacterium]
MIATDLPVALLAGGKATRLGAITQTIPKLLVEVAGEPFFNHQLRLLKAAGLTRVVLCIGHLGDQIVARYGDGSAWGVRIDYSFDGEKLLGTGGALVRALPKLGAAFYVLYGDSYLPIDYAAVGHAFLASGQPALMTVYENRGAYDTSNVWFEHGQLRLYSKTDRLPEMRHIDYGLSLFRADAFADCPRDAVVDLATVQSALSRRGQLAGFEVRQRFYEIGSPTGLAELDQLLRR